MYSMKKAIILDADSEEEEGSAGFPPSTSNSQLSVRVALVVEPSRSKVEEEAVPMKASIRERERPLGRSQRTRSRRVCASLKS